MFKSSLTLFITVANATSLKGYFDRPGFVGGGVVPVEYTLGQDPEPAHTFDELLD